MTRSHTQINTQKHSSILIGWKECEFVCALLLMLAEIEDASEWREVVRGSVQSDYG